VTLRPNDSHHECDINLLVDCETSVLQLRWQHKTDWSCLSVSLLYHRRRGSRWAVVRLQHCCTDETSERQNTTAHTPRWSCWCRPQQTSICAQQVGINSTQAISWYRYHVPSLPLWH